MAFFVIEGNIGAGKSTFLDSTQNYLNVQHVYEPVEQWQNINGHNLLDSFYKKGQRWAYTFQTFAFITRIRAQEEQAKQNPHLVQLLERSVYSDRYCFAKNAYELGLMSSLEWALYCEWFEWIVRNRLEQPAGFIYLRTEPEVCYKRLCSRGRSEEQTVALDYLQLLHDRHEDWLIHKKGIALYLRETPVLVLDVNEDFERNEKLQREYMSKVVEFVSKCGITESKKIVMPNVTL